MQYTSYYNLPQYEANDKTAWLTVFNQAMLDIDTGIHGAKAAADSADATATAAQSAATQASSDVSALTTSLNTLIGTVNTITSLIGNGEPTTTDKTIIGAINEINAKIPSGSVDANDVSYDNQTSGLTAINVQNAIDELKGDIDDIVVSAWTTAGTGAINTAVNVSATASEFLLQVSFTNNDFNCVLPVLKAMGSGNYSSGSYAGSTNGSAVTVAYDANANTFTLTYATVNGQSATASLSVFQK